MLQRVAQLYAAAFRDMGLVADDLVARVVSGPPTLPVFGPPHSTFAELKTAYYPAQAGKLSTDVIERFCAPSDGTSSPMPAPVRAVTVDGVRFGEPTISGNSGFALVENTNDWAIEPAGSGITFLDGHGKPLQRHYYSTLNRLIGPHKVGALAFFQPAGAATDWKKVRIAPEVRQGLLNSVSPLVTSTPTALSSSLGLLVADRIINIGDVNWCAALSAAVVRDGRAVAVGWEDNYCAKSGWTEVVRVSRGTKAGDAVFVELLFQRPE